MKLYLCLISLILAFVQGAEGQSNTIGQVLLNGDENFASEFLQSRIRSAPGEVFSQEQVDADIMNLRQLNGVLNAEYTIDSSAGDWNLIYDIESRGTLVPILGVGGIKNNFWFTAGVSEYNFNGRNQILEAYYLNTDKRHNAKIFFQNERIKAGRWGYSFDLVRLNSFEPLYFPTDAVNYDYKNHALGGNLINWLGRYTTLQGGVNFFVEDYKKDSPTPNEVPGPNQLTQRKLLSKLLLKQDKTQYDYFYRGGYNWTLLFQNVVTFNEPIPFFSVVFEVKKYIRTSYKGNLALRFKGALATNTDSPFAPFVLDSNFNLRGVGNRVDRGTGQLVFNLEYRHTLFRRNDWAFQVVAFTDTGSWRLPGAKLSDLWLLNEVRLFYGGGVRVIYNKHIETILRVDYGVEAINPNSNGIVIGVGQYF